MPAKAVTATTSVIDARVAFAGPANAPQRTNTRAPRPQYLTDPVHHPRSHAHARRVHSTTAPGQSPSGRGRASAQSATSRGEGRHGCQTLPRSGPGEGGTVWGPGTPGLDGGGAPLASDCVLCSTAAPPKRCPRNSFYDDIPQRLVMEPRVSMVTATRPRQLRSCLWRCLLFLVVCAASPRRVRASRGMCMYASIDRSGGRWRIPERCTHLYLSQVNFGPVGARQMGQALSDNPPVVRIDSSSCHIKGHSGATALGESLKVNNVVQRWDLGNNALGDTGAAAIADGLSSNTALKWLNLAHNRIGPAGAAGLADGLRQNSVLTYLNLDSNRIHDDGLAHLAGMLRVNRALETLILSGNQINNEGAALLAEALPYNQGLKTLHLKYNRISAEGARRLADAVVTHGGVAVSGPVPLEYSIARHQLKHDAWESKNATLMMDVARMYQDGARGSDKLSDRFAQAYCWCASRPVLDLEQCCFCKVCSSR